MLFDFVMLITMFFILSHQRDLKKRIATLQSQVDGLIALDQERE